MAQNVEEEEEENETSRVKKEEEVKENGDRRKSSAVDERLTTRLTWQAAVNCHEAPDVPASPSTLPPVETSVGLPRVRRASFEDQRPPPVKTNYELRRCKSEVANPSDPATPKPGNPAATAQNAFTSKDKIQANYFTFLNFKFCYCIITNDVRDQPFPNCVDFDQCD